MGGGRVVAVPGRRDVLRPDADVLQTRLLGPAAADAASGRGRLRDHSPAARPRPPQHEARYEQDRRDEAEYEPEEAHSEPTEAPEVQLDELEDDPFAGPLEIVQV